MLETIVAPATPHGVGGIGVVRLSGSRALEVSLKFLKLKTLTPRYATFAKIYSLDDALIDEGIVIYFKAPFSLTGEDVVEFQIHGGIGVMNLLIDEILKTGIRVANPGEFSKRAFLNSKMDLSKIEAIGAMISSRSSDSHRILAKQLDGELKEFVESLRGELVKTLAYAETCIDYAEEDLPEDILDETKALLDKNIKKLSDIVEISKQRKGLIDGFKIAIIGKPNVGKSSLLNALLRRDRAIISDEAGTTRDTIEESILVGTHLVKIVDTAGIRDTKSMVEKIGIESSLKAAKEADIVVAVFDSSSKFDEKDAKILEISLEAKKSGKKVINLLNKSDLEMKFDKELDDPLLISTKIEISPLLKVLKSYLDTMSYDGMMLISSRQILASMNAKDALIRALEKVNEAELELFSYEINIAINEISSIIRPFERSEILDEMFSNFCLGK